ncbi:MAG TPA: DUF2341 domain-containing protein [Verrucomicrobiae bacterium]|jgi:hypothetical protein|nr:DUF2341 domain-containing protein [Verrucomicrobiae bacterium]
MTKRILVSLGSAVLALAAALPTLAQSYSNAVMSLNPVAYWPLNETVQPPFGAYIATNIGTAGAAGNGYYQTWFQPLKTGTNVIYYQTNNVQHIPGPIGDGDMALNCTRSAAGAGGYVVFPRTTNGVVNSAVSLVPPFSIEFWCMPSSNLSQVMSIINEGRVPEQQGANLNFSTNETGFGIGQFGNNFYFATWSGSGQDSTKAELDTPLTTNVWQHMVITFDGTNQVWYKNGVKTKNAVIPASKGNALGQLYLPNLTAPLLIGTGSIIGSGNGASEYSGAIDDVAIYTNLLDPGAIANHYAAATATDSTYQNTVLADNPTIYVRLGEPAYPISNYPDPSTYPVATNYGVIGASGNGFYQPGTTPGVAGPAFAGFGGAASRAVAINGFSGAVDVGAGNLPAELNPTGKAPVTVTGWFQGNPADALSRFQAIASHNANSWRIAMDHTANNVRFNPGNNPELQFANVTDAVTNGFLVNDGNWHFVTGVSDGTNDYLYIDGLLAKSGTGVGNIVGTNGDALLGGDPGNLVPIFNGSATSQPRYFDGQIAQIAFFTNALSGPQIQQLYSVAGVQPFFIVSPKSTTNNAGANVTLSSSAHGSPPLFYQWYQDGTAVAGQTNAVLSYTPAGTNNSGNYVVVITNNYGAVTSSVVTLFLFGPPVIQQQSLSDVQVFAGTSPTLRVTAVGAQPIFYQWSLGGTPIPNATNSTYTIANIQAGGTYTCTLTNSVGSSTTTFSPVTVTVVPAPTAPYPTAVLASGPMAYYRLDEGPDDGQGDNGVTAYDKAGGLNGVYTNAFLDQPGYSVASDAGDSAVEFGDYPQQNPVNDFMGNVPTYLNFGTPTGNAQFTVEAWIFEYLFNPQRLTSGFGNSILAVGYGNGGEQFVLDTGGSSAGTLRFFVRNAAGTSFGANSSYVPAQDNKWHHVVGVCDEAGGQIRLYMDGVLMANTAIPPGSGLLSSTMPFTVGARESSNFQTVSNDFQFLGKIDEVAVYNRALSAAEIQNHYFAAGIEPVITQVSPQTWTTNLSASVTFTATVSGTAPLAYQWLDPNFQPLADQTNSTLTLSNLQVSQTGQYTLQVTNPYGSASTNVNLTVNQGPPVVTSDLSPLNQTVFAGSALSYSVGISGTPPLFYQWFQDGVAVTDATNSSYGFAALLGSHTYFVSVTNAQSGGTPTVSSTATVVGMATTTLNPSDYSDRMKITFSGYNRSETLQDFPVLVKLNTGISGFDYSHFASGTGGDLRFTDSGGTRVIPSEIDEWNLNGTSTIWVQMPALTGNNDFIWAYWGNPSDTTAPVGTNVWVPQSFENLPAYQVVYHLKEGAFPFVDSTLQHTATNGVAPGQTTGIVGTAGNFDGTDWLEAGTNDTGDAFTLSAWVNIPTATSDIQTLWDTAAGGFAMPGFALFVNTYQVSDQKIDFATGNGGVGAAGGNETTTAAGAVPFGSWHLVSAAVNRTNGTVQLYVDGNNMGSGTQIKTDFPTLKDLYLGQFANGGFDFHGAMDEARIRSGVSSSNWVWASWATVAQNSSLESYSTVTSTVPNPITVQFQISGGNLVLSGSAGAAYANKTYHVLSSTNVALPLAQWTPAAASTFDNNGNFNTALPLDAGVKSEFFRVAIP